MPRDPAEQKTAKTPESSPDEFDPVEEADVESFPASDPPAWTGTTGIRHGPETSERSKSVDAATAPVSTVPKVRAERGGKDPKRRQSLRDKGRS